MQCGTVAVARLAARGKVPAGGDGEHRAVLETGVQRFGGSGVRGGLGQPAAGEESAWAQDGHEGLLVVGASAAPRDDSSELHSVASDTGIAGSDAATQATDSEWGDGAESSAESAGGSQHQDWQRAQ